MSYYRFFSTLVLFAAGVLMVAVLQGCPTSQQAPAPPKPTDVGWEKIESPYYSMWRTPVPGGWIVQHLGDSTIYIPDKDHEWLKPKPERADEYRLYVAADRATYEAVRITLIQYDRLLDTDEPTYSEGLLDSWKLRLDAAERGGE